MLQYRMQWWQLQRIDTAAGGQDDSITEFAARYIGGVYLGENNIGGCGIKLLVKADLPVLSVLGLSISKEYNRFLPDLERRLQIPPKSIMANPKITQPKYPKY